MGRNRLERPIRILIANGHDILRAGLRAVLEGEGMEVVGDCATAGGVVQHALRLRPQVVLLDVRLPDGCGIEACASIRAGVPGTRILFFTDCQEHEEMHACLLAGADGHLPQPIASRELAAAIKAIAGSASGASCVPPANRPGACPEACAVKRDFATLSRQEHRVLSLVSEGKTNKEIGLAMGLSEKTVKNYLGNVFQKLDVRRRSRAAALFASWGRDAGSIRP